MYEDNDLSIEDQDAKNDRLESFDQSHPIQDWDEREDAYWAWLSEQQDFIESDPEIDADMERYLWLFESF